MGDAEKISFFHKCYVRIETMQPAFEGDKTYPKTVFYERVRCVPRLGLGAAHFVFFSKSVTSLTRGCKFLGLPSLTDLTG